MGGRLQQPGFRWALKSFLHQSGSEPVFHDSPTANVTSAGVECTRKGVVLMSDVSQCASIVIYDDGCPENPMAVADLPSNLKYANPVPEALPGKERRLYSN